MKIWCVEDDASILNLEQYTLKTAGYDTEGFADGKSFFRRLEEEQPDLVLLDVMLPEMNGFEILEKLRRDPATKDLPVIMTTALDSETDKVTGLEKGADYYLAKPFGMMEMAASVKAVLRRTHPDPQTLLTGGPIVLDRSRHLVTLDGQPVSLTYKEFELLACFLENKEIAMDRLTLLEKIWGMDFLGESRTVDMHVKTLRQKLKEAGRQIETLRNIGYRFHEKSA